MTIKEFVDVLDITMRIEYKGLFLQVEGFSSQVDKWLCHFKCGCRCYECAFYTGIGLRNGETLVEPTIEDVLDCLALEASNVNASKNFLDWATELGYNPDSIKDKNIYDSCRKQTERLKDFLGGNAFLILLSCVEGI